MFYGFLLLSFSACEANRELRGAAVFYGMTSVLFVIFSMSDTGAPTTVERPSEKLLL